MGKELNIGSIVYRQADENDKEELFSFYHRVYPEEIGIKCSDMWMREFVENPYRLENKLGIWIAIDQSTREIVGHTGVIYEGFKISDIPITMGWGVDLIINPDYRGKNIAYNLQKLMMEHVDAYMNISMADSTRYLSKKLGGIETEKVWQMLLPLRLTPQRISHYFYLRTFSSDHLFTKIVRRILKADFSKKLISYLHINILFNNLWRRRLSSPIHTQEYNMIEFKVDQHLELIDTLWKKYGKHFCNSAIRDKTYFNWKYAEFPFKRHHKFIITNQNVPVGYLVLRVGDAKEGNIGIIVDHLLDPSDNNSIDFCISYAKHFFLKRKIEFIYSIVSDEKSRDIFMKQGFKTTRIHRPTILSANQSLYQSIIDKNNWQLTFADHELDRYPLRGK